VEGEEVIKDGNDVYSERLGYANEAEKIGKKKAKYEEKLNSSNQFERATAERMVERLEKELEDLFTQQEIQEGRNVQGVAAYGGKLLATGGNVEGDPPYSIYDNEKASLDSLNTYRKARSAQAIAADPSWSAGFFGGGDKDLSKNEAYQNRLAWSKKLANEMSPELKKYYDDNVKLDKGHVLETYGNPSTPFTRLKKGKGKGNVTPAKSKSKKVTTDDNKSEYEGANPQDSLSYKEWQELQMEYNKITPSWLQAPVSGVPREENELAEGGKVNWANVGSTALNVAGQVGQMAIPLLDNLYNRKQIDKIPEIPLPEFQKAREFDTEYNINPQLQEVDDTIKSYNTGVARSSIQPQVTRANSLIANIKGMKEKNLLRGQKENIESRLSNQSQINKQTVDATNIAKRENYRMNKYLRTNEILGMESANVANAVEDVQLGIRNMNQRALDNRKITLDAAKHSDTGVSGQLLNDKNYVTSLRLNKANQNQMKDTIISSGRKDYIEQWNKLFPNNKISDKVETKDIPKDKEETQWANPVGINDFEGTHLT